MKIQDYVKVKRFHMKAKIMDKEENNSVIGEMIWIQNHHIILDLKKMLKQLRVDQMLINKDQEWKPDKVLKVDLVMKEELNMRADLMDDQKVEMIQGQVMISVLDQNKGWVQNQIQNKGNHMMLDKLKKEQVIRAEQFFKVDLVLKEGQFLMGPKAGLDFKVEDQSLKEDLDLMVLMEDQNQKADQDLEDQIQKAEQDLKEDQFKKLDQDLMVEGLKEDLALMQGKQMGDQLLKADRALKEGLM